MSTYDPLLERGKLLVGLVEEFIERIMKPLNRELKGLEFCIEGKRVRPRECWVNEKNWQKFRQLLEDNKLTLFYMGPHYEGAGASPPLNAFIEIRIESKYYLYYLGDDEPTTASFIGFSVERGLYGERVPQEVQQFYVEALEKLCVSLQGVGGFITVDAIQVNSADSPHESYVGLSYSWASRQFHRYYRGYFWGNFLSPGHVELLGGPEKVTLEAPVYKARRLDDGGMFLQLTPHLDEVTDDDLRKLKTYLTPILPPILRKAALPQEYQHMRVITDE